MPGTSLHSAVIHDDVHVLERVPEFDGIRGLAIAMVLWVHCFLLPTDTGFARFLNSIGGSMFIGVDLFFVLSGFLITSILIRTNGDLHRARNFYFRRVLRIFPAYYFVLIFVFVICPIFHISLRATLPGKDAAFFFLYAQNWWLSINNNAVDAWPGLTHLWSLAIEEQFYLLWPLIVWLTPPMRLAKVCAWIFAVTATLKLGLLFAGANADLLFLSTPCRLEGLAAGAGLAALWQTDGIRKTPPWLREAGLLASVCLLLLIFSNSGIKASSPKQIVAHAILASVAFSWLIFSAISADPRAIVRRALRSRLLCFLGRYSYGIYLIHWIVYWQLNPLVPGMLPETTGANSAAVISGAIIVVTTIFLALVMYRLIEQPALSLKRNFTRPGS